MAVHRLIRILTVLLPLVVIVLVAIPARNYWMRLGTGALAEKLADKVLQLPKDVSVMTEGFTYSQAKGGKTRFTLKAKLNLGFKDNKQTFRGVDLTVFGEKEGEAPRHVTGDECAYDPQTEDIHCVGKVDVDLDEHTQAHTEELIYNGHDRRITSPVKTNIEQPGAMTGDADRMEYTIDSGLLQMTGNVGIHVTRLKGGNGGEDLHTGAAVFQQKENWVTVSGGVFLQAPNGWVRGSTGRADLQPGSYRPTQMVIEGGVTAESHMARSNATWALRSDWMQSRMSAAGNLDHVLARGSVRVDKKSSGSSQVLQGNEVEASIDEHGQVSIVEARQNASLDLAADRKLNSTRIVINADGGIATEDASVLNVGDARMDGRQFFIAQGDVITFSTKFPATLTSAGRVSSADRTDAQFDSKTSHLISLDQVGHFEFRESGRHGHGNSAHVTDDGDTVALSGAPAVYVDGERTLEAQEIRLGQKSNSFAADRAVKMTQLKAGSDPVLVLANHAEGNADRVTYTGKVDLYRGTMHIAANLVEASTKDRGFHALGLGGSNVRSQMDAFKASADILDYDDARQSALYTGRVKAQKQDVILESAELTLRADQGQVSEADARGGVVITQGTRRGTGDHAVYNAKTDQITLTGPNAEVRDPAQGSVKGTILTMNKGGDTVVVQGENPGRVVSKRKITK